jgi:hypothetical protein
VRAHSRAARAKPNCNCCWKPPAKALDDAGIGPHDIDGIGPPLGASAEHFGADPGIEDLRYSTYVQMGGGASRWWRYKALRWRSISASPIVCWCRADGTVTRWFNRAALVRGALQRASDSLEQRRVDLLVRLEDA